MMLHDHCISTAGTTIAIVPLVGLILNVTPFGIQLTPVLISLLGVCGVLRKCEEKAPTFRAGMNPTRGTQSTDDSTA
jgi:Predicted membrane protein